MACSQELAAAGYKVFRESNSSRETQIEPWEVTPDSIEALQNCPEAYQIFRDVGWLEYFQKLTGSNKEIVMEFARNLNKYHTKVRGLHI